MKTLHVSAGGRGERIAAYIASIRPSLPKHLLPIPTEGKTILGEIILKAHSYFDKITIWTSKETYPWMVLAFKDLVSVEVRVDTEMTGPLGAMARELLTTKQRVFACAGDFYCNFSWEEFERFHDAHGLPISILIAKSVPAPGGARFYLKNSNIIKWERVKKTKEDDRINIGCYIVDPIPEVISGLETLKKHKEDIFFNIFVPKKLVAGYDPVVPGFNVNVAEVYEHLLHVLAQGENK